MQFLPRFSLEGDPPSLGAAQRPVPRNLSGAQTELSSNYNINHSQKENKGSEKFFFKKPKAAEKSF